MDLVAWDKRSAEEAYLFNPAFIGLLVIEFVKEFEKAKGFAAPFALPFCAMPIALHPKTRKALPGTTLTSMYTWLERNSETVVGYKERANGLRPAVQEAIRFALDREALKISGDGGLTVGEKKVAAGARFENAISRDARECVQAARFLGRWLAKAGTTSTVLAGWGIKP